MAGRGVTNPLKLAAVVLIGAVILFQVLRAAAVADRQAHPGLAAQLWRSHPAVLTDGALLAIGKSAARGGGAPAATQAVVRSIAAKAPLSPDPFVIEGAIATTQGRSQAAEELLLAARERDPRSRGARYLLADHYLRGGKVAAGLVEIQSLFGLQAHGADAFAPALVAYARTPGAVPQLRAFFRQNPRVEGSVLSVLANDAANAGLVQALATRGRKPDPDWRGPLVTALAAAGRYQEAYATWARLTGLQPRPGLFNPGFATMDVPPPFNWSYPTGSDGIAEADGKGGLKLLYYGRADAVLASQLLLLPQGKYRLAMAIDGTGGEAAIHWTLRCAAQEKPFADLPLRGGAAGGSLAVPENCQAQWLELRGIAGDMPEVTELTVRDLRLEPEAGR